MSEPPSSRERWLAELHRELRPVGWRRRRRALAEASDHLISAIEDEIAAGASREDAEQRAVARFGEPATIGASLRAVRPRRRSRLTPAAVAAGAITAVLALAAGPIADGIAPRRAVAAESPGPSPRRCARAFDQSANVTVRQLVSGSTVLRVQIIPTLGPLVRDQVPALEPTCAHRAVAVEGRHGDRVGRDDPSERTRRGRECDLAFRSAECERSRCGRGRPARPCADRRYLRRRLERRATCRGQERRTA